MLTAPRLSFPKCLFHPRSILLLCHLDSPSAANLPCFRLQRQTRPEVFELCGSYRVPSRSYLLPLRTLSSGENHSQANNLFFQPQSPLSPGESVVQLTNKPPLRGHKTNGENGHGISNRLNNGGWSHGYGFRQGSMHRLDAQTEDVSAFQNQHKGYPRNQHRLFFPVSELHPVFCRGRMGCTIQKIR
jgi:hypothetical protein